jgi:hypothetical protein
VLIEPLVVSSVEVQGSGTRQPAAVPAVADATGAVEHRVGHHGLGHDDLRPDRRR